MQNGCKRLSKENKKWIGERSQIIAANPDSWPGQVVLMIQVILGYVLLGALVTRLAVLFTSDGPAGSFTPMDKETKELLAKLKEDKEKG